MTTVAQLVDKAKNRINGPYRTTLDELGAGMDGVQTTATLTWTPNIQPNTVLSVGTEDLLVRSYDANNKIATVRRGWRGSVATTHSAADEVEVNPRWTNVQIRDAMIEEVRSWPSTLFRPTITTPEIDATSSYVDLVPVGDARVLYVTTQSSTVTDLGWHSLSHVRTRPTATGIRLELGSFLGSGYDLEVHWASGFAVADSDWVPDASVEDDIGLAPSMLDIPPMGAALRLLGFSEISRTDRSLQGESRWAEESPAMHAVQAMQALWRFRNQRIQDEAARLMQRYPVMGA